MNSKSEKRPFKVLFVCLGNICRSPTAHGMFEHLIEERGLGDRIAVDSAGTYGGHSGNLPDHRMRAHAARRGLKLTHRSRQVRVDDFEEFDLILGMDDKNIQNLRDLAPTPEAMDKIERMTDYGNDLGYDYVPDPYYSGAEGFELVLDLLENACSGLLDDIEKNKL